MCCTKQFAGNTGVEGKLAINTKTGITVKLYELKVSK